MYNKTKIKQDFIEFCLKKDKELENLSFNPICKNNMNSFKKYEVIMIECSRKLPHLEHLIKNSIHKIDTKTFSFSIVCTQDNKDFMKNIVYKLSPLINIEIHCLDKQIKNRNDYNNLLLSTEFWALFAKKEKVLIMQEDTYIFKNNLEDFLSYDYIGAPWNNSVLTKYDLRVGNGGLSLRSISLIKEALDNKSNIIKMLIKHKKFSQHDLDQIPEDIFFSFSCIFLNKYYNKCYSLAHFQVAKSFSQENVLSDDCFGGHQFWNCDVHWRKKIN